MRAGLILLAFYGVLSLLMDPGGFLGTDTGAKVATLEVMLDEGGLEPNVGYWAEEWDPDGSVHPILDSQPVDDGWVHVTTLPMLELARPLYDVGGYRLALLLPMTGAVGAAFGARSLARRAARSESVGWSAYWVVGALSPLVVYALDLWEHAPGVACVVGAVALLAGVVDGEAFGARSLGAGLLLGVAATMRTEALVYTAVAVGAACLLLLWRDRSVRTAAIAGVLAMAGFAVPWTANAVLEEWVGGNSRAARASGTIAEGGAQAEGRIREAATTFLALRPIEFGRTIALGGTMALLLVVAVVAARRSQPRLVAVGLVGAGILHLTALAQGLGFVPGLLAAAPIAVAGLATAPPSLVERFVFAVAVGALPLVWAFQFLGGALPQWAGRYILSSCTLLVVLGVSALIRSTRQVWLGFLLLAGVVTASGVAWLGERSHEMERLFDDLVERPEDVVIARNGFFVREGGAAYTERRWLSAVTDDDLDEAVEVVRDAGLETFAVLDEAATARPLDGAREDGTTPAEVVGVTLYLHSYRIQ